MTDKNLTFSLSRYKNQPEKNVTVLDAAAEYSSDEITSITDALIATCDLSAEDIVYLL